MNLIVWPDLPHFKPTNLFKNKARDILKKIATSMGLFLFSF